MVIQALCVGDDGKAAVLYPFSLNVAQPYLCKAVVGFHPVERTAFKAGNRVVHREYTVVSGEVNVFPFKIAVIGENRILNLWLVACCAVGFKAERFVIQLNAHAVFIALVRGGVGLPTL